MNIPAADRAAMFLTMHLRQLARGTTATPRMTEVCFECGLDVGSPRCTHADCPTITVPAPQPRTHYRLYRTAADGDRVAFTTATDSSIPLVDGVTVFVASLADRDEVIALAHDGGLDVVHATPGDRERAAGAMFRCVIRARQAVAS